MFHIFAFLAAAITAPMSDDKYITPSRQEMIAAATASVVKVEVNGKDKTTIGTGFIIDGAQGIIVTADFIVADGGNITVKTSGGETMPAETVGFDSITGVGVLRVDEKKLPALKFCENPARIGDEAVNLGYPFGMGPFAYTGTIAGYEKSGPVMMLDIASPNGTAGAPVLSSRGCVLGSVMASFKDVPHLGAAVPGEVVQKASTELTLIGHVNRGWVGVSLLQADGIVVGKVAKDGPAEIAGLLPGDRIDAYDGQPVKTGGAVMHYLQTRSVLD